eukprot:11407-Heterococcus_DN1.PRE.2
MPDQNSYLGCMKCCIAVSVRDSAGDCRLHAVLYIRQAASKQAAEVRMLADWCCCTKARQCIAVATMSHTYTSAYVLALMRSSQCASVLALMRGVLVHNKLVMQLNDASDASKDETLCSSQATAHSATAAPVAHTAHHVSVTEVTAHTMAQFSASDSISYHLYNVSEQPSILASTNTFYQHLITVLLESFLMRLYSFSPYDAAAVAAASATLEAHLYNRVEHRSLVLLIALSPLLHCCSEHSAGCDRS